jgi:hypothetical protein
MSDIIEGRISAARFASLHQQRPSALIDAVEGREAVNTYRQTSTVVGESPGSYIVTGSGGIGSSFLLGLTGALVGTVVIIDNDYPTGAPVLIQEVAAAMLSPEWAMAGDNRWARWAETTKGLLQKADPRSGSARSAAAKLRVDRISAIQASFGLSTAALSDVLRVTRPTLYKWLDASRDITLQEASRQRFDAIERLAREWSSRSNAPIASVGHEPLKGGLTVQALLTADAVEEAVIAAAFDELIAKLQGRPKSLSQKMAEAGFGRRPSRRSVPDDE